MAKPPFDPKLLELPPGIYALSCDVVNPKPHSRNNGWEFDATWHKGRRFYIRDDADTIESPNGDVGRRPYRTIHAKWGDFPTEIRLTGLLHPDYQQPAWIARMAAILPHLVPDAQPTLADWLTYVDHCCSRYHSGHVGSEYLLSACEVLVSQGIVSLDTIKLAMVTAKAEDEARYAREDAAREAAKGASHGS